MADRHLHLWLETADGQRTPLASLTWPDAHDAEGRRFISDNLLGPRATSRRQLNAWLQSGRVTPADRVAFLADRPASLPEPPDALNEEALEAMAAAFGVALRAFRAAAPDTTLGFHFT